ncbi:acyl carrier protein [Ktedonobacter robiniae]|uniref:Carrier domain-containing protein n=1 Tax=Ktedonobacter robiniae TaxID=2778365 RepID=A0ABQ3V4N0_9CHLR|nr:acyl carrier protein [Ktedonobacter robiniae]GHO60134.1 hypothetical protein KSB_86090 [Ktedonobacter robiniae]
MSRIEIVERLKQYFITEVLDGKDIGLDESTPLLEWGVINSLEIVRLLGFIQQQFGVEVPADDITAEYFSSLLSITDLILMHEKAARP